MMIRSNLFLVQLIFFAFFCQDCLARNAKGSLKVVGNKSPPNKVLYVWTGSGVQGADYLAVVDFKKGSKTYGKIINKVEVDGTATRTATGNEPHHVKIVKTSKGKNVLVATGLLSFLQGKDDVFVWNLDKPTSPKLAASYNLPGGCADEINPFQHGDLNGVMITMMCNDAAVSPGHLGFLDPVTGTFFDWVNSTDYVNFNPHGFAVHPNGKYLLATDCIVPGSLVSGPPVFQNTLRRFDLDRSNPVLDHTYTLGTGVEGFLDFEFIPGTTQGYAFGTVSNLVYFLDVATTDPPVQVLDLAQAVNGGKRALSTGQVRYLKSGNYLFQSFGKQFLVGLDITDRMSPKVSFVHDFARNPSLVHNTLIAVPTILGRTTCT